MNLENKQICIRYTYFIGRNIFFDSKDWKVLYAETQRHLVAFSTYRYYALTFRKKKKYSIFLHIYRHLALKLTYRFLLQLASLER